MKCLEISVAAFLGQSVKEVRPPATCAEERLVGRTSSLRRESYTRRTSLSYETRRCAQSRRESSHPSRGVPSGELSQVIEQARLKDLRASLQRGLQHILRHREAGDGLGHVDVLDVGQQAREIDLHVAKSLLKRFQTVDLGAGLRAGGDNCTHGRIQSADARLDLAGRVRRQPCLKLIER